MHIARLLFAVAVFSTPLTPAFGPVPAVAQQALAANPCQGDLNVVRISEIKPGMMAKFLAAVAAQQAWYKGAGTTDKIEVMRIMDRDPNTKAYSLSETQAITTHSMSTSAKNPAHDAGYDAFVAMFGASSTIKTTYTTCMAKM